VKIITSIGAGERTSKVDLYAEHAYKSLSVQSRTARRRCFNQTITQSHGVRRIRLTCLEFGYE
jgi:hypothetical protein